MSRGQRNGSIRPLISVFKTAYVYITVLNATFTVLYTPYLLFMMKRDMIHAYLGDNIFAIRETTHEHASLINRCQERAPAPSLSHSTFCIH
jgi:hypothetical protein